ncbi:MAG: hypothetical protein ABIH46_07045 [Chloroflexota bacterium]
MTTALTTSQYCILMRSGVEVWATKERTETLRALLKSPNVPQYVEYEDRLFNTNEVAGIFTAEDMEAKTRRRNSQWQCHLGMWHDRGEKCVCVDAKTEEERSNYEKNFYRENGYYPPKS